MSGLSVRREISRATENDPPAGCIAGATIDEQDADRILKAAAPRPSSLVSNVERRLITDLYDRQLPPQDPNAFVTMACPENPGLVQFTPEADSKFNVFFARHNIPRGEPLANQLREIVSNLGYGPEVTGRPDLSGHVYVLLHDKRPVDGDRAEAFVNFASGEYYVKSTPSGFGAPGAVPKFFGPNRLDAGLSPEGKRNLLERFRNSGASFSYEMPLPLGVKFYRAELMAERHPDGYQYAALVPVGALTPTAPTSDPDDAQSFYVERSGGLAGLTAYAGPIDLGPVICPR